MVEYVLDAVLFYFKKSKKKEELLLLLLPFKYELCLPLLKGGIGNNFNEIFFF